MNDIEVHVETEFLHDRSNVNENHFAFGYTVTIYNHSEEPARLLQRHWIITDANGDIQEVRGQGVIGEQPLIYPGQHFRYTSGAVLSTPVGSMQGTYSMINHRGEFFDAIIPPFSLRIPGLIN